MERKIVFLDIDGTLVPERSAYIPESARAAIARAQAQGHLVFINTGRAWSNMDRFLFDTPFDGFICGCGTYIVYRGEVLLHKVLSEEACRCIYRSALDCGMDFMGEADHGLYCDLSTYQTREARNFIEDLKTRYDLREDTPASQMRFDKFITWTSRNGDLKRFIREVSPYVTYTDRGGIFSEYVPCGYTKATGIDFVLDKLSLSVDNTYAIGDGPNDLPMLRHVAHPIVMGNSSPASMFDEAEYVTTDILEDGIANAFEKFILK